MLGSMKDLDAMKTPNPRGMVRDTTWDKLTLAVREPTAHWSYNEALRSRGAGKRQRQAALLRAI
jgi:hypothetical protein